LKNVSKQRCNKCAIFFFCVFVVALQVYYFCECETARRRFEALPKLELADGQKCATGQMQALVETDWRGPEPADFESCLSAKGLWVEPAGSTLHRWLEDQAVAAEAPTPFRDCKKGAPGFALRHAAAVLAKFLTSHEHCGGTLSRGEKRLRQTVPTFEIFPVAVHQ
jgi:hypothetical protein